MSNAPRFDSEFLESVAFAFRKRRKAIRHQACSADLAKVYELVNADRMERLEIYVRTHDGAVLRLHAWPDRVIWLDARQSAKKGWAWSWTREGRLLGTHGAPDVIRALETTFALFYKMNHSRSQELSGPWSALLAQALKVVR
jgi:hypothetical protein